MITRNVKVLCQERENETLNVSSHMAMQNDALDQRQTSVITTSNAFDNICLIVCHFLL